MTALGTNRALQTGARGIISGTVSNGATWYEDVDITENDTVVTSADTWTWTMTFADPLTPTSADLTLSTTAGTLIISQGSSSTTLQIRVAAADLSAMEGDFICNLKSLDSVTTYDSAGRSIHWAHGMVTFLDEPL